jgi:hypothetical protein
MRFLSEYTLYVLAMLVAIVVFVRPTIRDRWPLAAKVSFYVISGVLFLSVVLFEYLSRTSVADLVRDAVGKTFCGIYRVAACPERASAPADRLAVPSCRGLDETECKARLADCMWIVPAKGSQSPYCRLRAPIKTTP